MFSSSRISRVFESSKEIIFDDSSKIVLMSDCHRGTGSWADSFADNSILFHAALDSYYRENYTYIEIGDGDELWENKNMRDIMTTYKSIFELLSHFYMDKRLYLLYGNHDMENKDRSSRNKHGIYPSDIGEDIAFFFSNIEYHEGLILKHKDTDHCIFLIHGNQVDLINGPLWKIGRFFVRCLWRPLELLGVNDPTSASKNRLRKQSVEKKLKQWSEKNKQMLIAGHTHKYVFPSPGEPLYFNDGCCQYRGYITAVELADGHISLIKWSKKIRRDGTLYVGRDIIDGPVKLRDLFEQKNNAV